MTRAADEVIIEIPWEMWCRLGIKGQDWLRLIATGSEGLSDGGYRVKMADYRLAEFTDFCERMGEGR